MNKKTCILPWVRISSSCQESYSAFSYCPFSDVTKNIPNVDPYKDEIKDVWNNHFMKQERLKFLSGEIQCESEKCEAFKKWVEFETNVDDVKTSEDGSVDTFPVMYDLVVGKGIRSNLEGLNQIGVDHSESDGKLPANISDYIPHMKYLVINNPFYNFTNFNFLKHLVDIGKASDIKLSTNCNFILSDKISLDNIIDVLKEFKKVVLEVSVDDISNQTDYYCNHHYNKSEFSNNFKNFLHKTKTLENIEITIRVPLHLFNINECKKIIVWRNNLILNIGKQIKIRFERLLTLDKYAHPKLLPEKLKEKIKNELQEFPYNRMFDHSALMFTIMDEQVDDEERTQLLFELKFYIYMVKKKKGLDFQDYFPELYQAFLEEGTDLMDFS